MVRDADRTSSPHLVSLPAASRVMPLPWMLPKAADPGKSERKPGDCRVQKITESDPKELSRRRDPRRKGEEGTESEKSLVLTQAVICRAACFTAVRHLRLGGVFFFFPPVEQNQNLHTFRSKKPLLCQVCALGAFPTRFLAWGGKMLPLACDGCCQEKERQNQPTSSAGTSGLEEVSRGVFMGHLRGTSVPPCSGMLHGTAGHRSGYGVMARCAPAPCFYTKATHGNRLASLEMEFPAGYKKKT